MTTSSTMNDDAPFDPDHAVVVNRWCRFGHDRAYVRRGALDLGYRNLLTGETVVRHAGSDRLIEAVTAQLYADAAARRAASASGNVTMSPARDRSGDDDLSLNRPGEALLAKAAEHRAEAPIRSFFQRLVDAKTDERACRVGGEGEQAVGAQLVRLGPEWRVIHTLPGGTRESDIDHLVIGPAGVFTVNSKHHPDARVWVRGNTFKVNGCDVPYVRNSRHEAQRAARLLSAAARLDVDVTGIIACYGVTGGFKVVEQPRDGVVRVIKRREITGYLQGLPVVLGDPSIRRIFEVARWRSTWSPSG